MRRNGQPQALSVRAQQNGPLDLKLTARGRRAYLAVPNEQAIMPSQKLRQAHCREGVEALPPRRSAAGAAGRPPERSRGAAPRGLIYMLSPHHSKLAHVPSVRRPDFITPGLHANRRLQARWPDLALCLPASKRSRRWPSSTCCLGTPQLHSPGVDIKGAKATGAHSWVRSCGRQLRLRGSLWRPCKLTTLLHINQGGREK